MQAGTHPLPELSARDIFQLTDDMIAEHITPVVRRHKDGGIVVAYAMYDPDCQNPLEDCDGMGRVHSAHRSAGREVHEAMQEALGLDSDWSPDENAVTAGMAKLAKSNSIAAADLAKKDLKTQYHELRRLRLVGDMYVQTLDVYDHSGISYSISGEGMQCRWDTSRGGAVWVPDTCARDECDRRAGVYAWGRVIKLKSQWQAVLDIGVWPHKQESLGLFATWHEAFRALQDKVKELELTAETLERLAIGRARATEDVARGAVDEYNAWLSGDCYGVKVVHVEPESDDPHCDEFRFIEELDACWGYVGSDYAEDTLLESIQPYATEEITA